MKLTTRQLTLCGVLTTLALALSVAENQLPLTLAIPIPGIKLGLANIGTVCALYALGPAQAVLILLARCILGALFAGNMNALLFSLMGGLAAMGVMILLSRLRALSVYGVSIGPQLRAGGGGGAVSGQYCAAVLSAGFAGGIPADRRVYRPGRRVPVPRPGAHGSCEEGLSWSETTTKRTRSSCSSWN